jgi:hypothetical protein
MIPGCGNRAAFFGAGVRSAVKAKLLELEPEKILERRCSVSVVTAALCQVEGDRAVRLWRGGPGLLLRCEAGRLLADPSEESRTPPMESCGLIQNRRSLLPAA